MARRVDSGRLHPIHLGVYAVGHPILDRRGRWMAAVLACGQGAALGYTSAGALWNLQRAFSGPAHVVVPGSAGRGRSGIRVHRHPGLTPGEVTTRERIPVTTPARTILDLAATVGDRRLKHALDQAEVQELTDYPRPRSPGPSPRPPPRSDAPPEAPGDLRGRHRPHEIGPRGRVPRSLRAPRPPEPPRQRGVATGLTVDFVFARERVAVEIDSWRWHRGRAAFERDRARDALLATKGYRTLRFTDRQIEHDPRTVVRALAAALSARAA